MSIYKITIQYKGTNYQGFQIQNNGQTIQGVLNSALGILAKSEEVKTIGSGRTDAGVHALGQIVRVEIPLEIPEMGLLKGLNAHLPTDIRVSHVQKCAEDFHPIFHAQSKEYNYVFCLGEIQSPFSKDLMTQFPKDLDIELMNQAAKLFCGTHDFLNYQCTGTDVATTTRRIDVCEIIPCQSTNHWRHFEENYYVLKIVGNGFLKQMVRLIMGALIAVGRGKVTLEEVKASLTGNPLQNRLGPTAPAQGLYLVEVHY